MARIIVLRLHPDKAVKASEFQKYLVGLKIEAFDASFAEPGGHKGAALGSTANAPSKIVQHKVLHPDPAKAALGQKLTKSVATAMIVLAEPAPPEYAEPDIILHVVRAGQIIRKVAADYNVALFKIADKDFDPKTFDPGTDVVGPTSVAAYVELPAPGLSFDPSDAVVDLQKDGTPPNFTDLQAEVVKVLQKDPGGTQKLGSLSVAECRHIAHEIAWNRHVEPIPFASTADFEKMYTVKTDPLEPELDSNAQQQFQGSLAQYHAVHDADADALAKYISALSAALACEKKSAGAPRAGLSFPIQPGIAPTGKVQDAEVVLEN